MSDYNETVQQLQKRLGGCFETSDGKIYWYEGTIELLFKLVGYLFKEKERED